jgi:hypothetical protein
MSSKTARVDVIEDGMSRGLPEPATGPGDGTLDRRCRAENGSDAIAREEVERAVEDGVTRALEEPERTYHEPETASESGTPDAEERSSGAGCRGSGSCSSARPSPTSSAGGAAAARTAAGRARNPFSAVPPPRPDRSATARRVAVVRGDHDPPRVEAHHYRP